MLLDNGLEAEVFDSIKKYYAHNNNVIQLDKNKINELDNIIYLNHHKNPNLDYINGNYITNKIVKKGEELTLDYKKDNYCRECIDFKIKKQKNKKTKKTKKQKNKKKQKTYKKQKNLQKQKKPTKTKKTYKNKKPTKTKNTKKIT